MRQFDWAGIKEPDRVLQDHCALWRYLIQREHRVYISALRTSTGGNDGEPPENAAQAVNEPDRSSIASIAGEDANPNIEQQQVAQGKGINSTLSSLATFQNSWQGRCEFFRFELLTDLRKSLAKKVLDGLVLHSASGTNSIRSENQTQGEAMGQWGSVEDENGSAGMALFGEVSRQVLRVCRDAAFHAMEKTPMDSKQLNHEAIDVFLAALDALLVQFSELPPLSLQRHCSHPQFSTQLQALLHLLADTCSHRLRQAGPVPSLPLQHGGYADASPQDLVFWKSLEVHTVIVLATGSVGHLLVLSSTLLRLSTVHQNTPVTALPVLSKCMAHFSQVFEAKTLDNGIIADWDGSEPSAVVVNINAKNEVPSGFQLEQCGQVKDIVSCGPSNFVVLNRQGRVFTVDVLSGSVRLIPQEVTGTISSISQLRTSAEQSQASSYSKSSVLAISSVNTTYVVDCSGDIHSYQLFEHVPEALFSSRHKVAQLCAGGKHYLFRTESGCSFAVGMNDYGQCGIAPKTPAMLHSPCIVMDDLGELTKVKYVAAGDDFSLFVSDSGMLFGCGNHSVGQLGLGPPPSIVTTPASITTPKQIPFPTSITRILDLSCGKRHTLALTESTTGTQLFAFGSTRKGQCGIPRTSPAFPVVWEPTAVGTNFDSQVVQVSCHDYVSAILTTKGSVYAWGKPEHSNTVLSPSKLEQVTQPVAAILLSSTSLLCRCMKQRSDDSDHALEPPATPSTESMTLETVFDRVVDILGFVLEPGKQVLYFHQGIGDNSMLSEDLDVIHNVQLVLSQLLISISTTSSQAGWAANEITNKQTKTVQQILSLLRVLLRLIRKLNSRVQMLNEQDLPSLSNPNSALCEVMHLRDILCTLCFEESFGQNSLTKFMSVVNQDLKDSVRQEAITILGEAFPLLFEAPKEQAEFLVNLLKPNTETGSSPSIDSKVDHSATRIKLALHLTELLSERFWSNLFASSLWCKEEEQDMPDAKSMTKDRKYEEPHDDDDESCASQVSMKTCTKVNSSTSQLSMVLVERLLLLAFEEARRNQQIGMDVVHGSFATSVRHMQISFLSTLRDRLQRHSGSDSICSTHMSQYVDQLLSLSQGRLEESRSLASSGHHSGVTHITFVLSLLQPFTAYVLSCNLQSCLDSRATERITGMATDIQNILHNASTDPESQLDNDTQQSLLDCLLSVYKIVMENWFGTSNATEHLVGYLYSKDNAVNEWLSSNLFKYGLAQPRNDDGTSSSPWDQELLKASTQAALLERISQDVIRVAEYLAPISSVNKIRFKGKAGSQEIWMAHKLVFLAILWHHPNSFSKGSSTHIQARDPSDDGKIKVSAHIVNCWNYALRILTWLSRQSQITGESYSISAVCVGNQARLLLNLESASGFPNEHFLTELRHTLSGKDILEKISKQTFSTDNDSQEGFSSSVIRFVMARNASEVENVLKNRISAAKARCIGLKAFSKLVRTAVDQRAVRYIFSSLDRMLGPAEPSNLFEESYQIDPNDFEDPSRFAQQSTESPQPALKLSIDSRRYFLAHLNGVGVSLESRVRNAYFQMLSEVFVERSCTASTINPRESNNELLQFALPLIQIDFQPEDLPFVQSSELIKIVTEGCSFHRLEQIHDILLEAISQTVAKDPLDPPEPNQISQTSTLELWRLEAERVQYIRQGEAVWSALHSHQSLKLNKQSSVISSPANASGFTSPLSARLGRGYFRSSFVVQLLVEGVPKAAEDLENSACFVVGLVDSDYNAWDSFAKFPVKHVIPSVRENTRVTVWVNLETKTISIFLLDQSTLPDVTSNSPGNFSPSCLVACLDIPAEYTGPWFFATSILSPATSLAIRPLDAPPSRTIHEHVQMVEGSVMNTETANRMESSNVHVSSNDCSIPARRASELEYSAGSDSDTNYSGSQFESDLDDLSTDSDGAAIPSPTNSQASSHRTGQRQRRLKRRGETNTEQDELGTTGPLGSIVETDTEVSVYVFGQNAQGELGLNSKVKSQKEPVLSKPLTDLSPIQVVAGNEITAVLTRTGHVYTIGFNKVGSCATGRFDNNNVVQPTSVRIPKRVVALCGVHVKKLCASNGCEQVFAIATDGSVYAWGYNKYGQLGIGQTNDVVIHPRPVEELKNKGVETISNSYSHTLALTNSGHVYSFGLNSKGQLGIGSHRNMYARPHLITRLADIGPVQSIAVGAEHSAVCTVSGKVYTFGRNHVGQLGIGASQGMSLMPVPTQVVNGPSRLRSLKCQAVACGYYFTVVIAEGTLHSFGVNNYGQLGVGHTRTCFSPTPVKIEAPKSTPYFTSVSCGTGHVVACSSDGQVIGWGRNRFGGVGDGSLADHPFPVQIHNKGQLASLRKSSRILQIATGFHHSVVLVGQPRDRKYGDAAWLPLPAIIALRNMDSSWELLQSILTGFTKLSNQVQSLEVVSDEPGHQDTTEERNVNQQRKLEPCQVSIFDWLIATIQSMSNHFQDMEWGVSCSWSSGSTRLSELFHSSKSVGATQVRFTYYVHLIELLCSVVNDTTLGMKYVEHILHSRSSLLEVLIQCGLQRVPNRASVVSLRVLRVVLPSIASTDSKTGLDGVFLEIDDKSLPLVGEESIPTAWLSSLKIKSETSTFGFESTSGDLTSQQSHKSIPGYIAVQRLLRVIGSISCAQGLTCNVDSLKGSGNNGNDDPFVENALAAENASSTHSVHLRMSFEVLSELVIIYRRLLQSPNWQNIANLAFSGALKFAPRFVDKLPKVLQVYLESQGFSKETFSRSDSKSHVFQATSRKYSIESADDVNSCDGLEVQTVESEKDDDTMELIGEQNNMEKPALLLASVRSLFGMLNVLGGNFEIVREGGRVKMLTEALDNKGQEGFVLWHRPGDRFVAQVRTSYRGSDELVNIRDDSELFAVSSVPVPVESIHLPHRVLNVLVKLVQEEVLSPNMIIGEDQHVSFYQDEHQEVVNSGVLFVSLMHEISRMSAMMVIQTMLSQSPELVRGFVARGHLPAIASLITSKSLHSNRIRIPMLLQRLCHAELLRRRSLEVERAFATLQLFNPGLAAAKEQSELAYFSPDATVSPQLVDGSFTGQMIRRAVATESATWVCAHCTFENQVIVSHCQMCENSRSSRPSTQSVAPSTKTNPDAAPEEATQVDSVTSITTAPTSNTGCINREMVNGTATTQQDKSEMSCTALDRGSGYAPTTRFRKSYRPMVTIETGFARTFDFDGAMPTIRFATLTVHRINQDNVTGNETITHSQSRPRWGQVPHSAWQSGVQQPTPLRPKSDRKETTVKHVLRLLDTQFVKLNHGFHRNGLDTSVYLNQYTVIMDVCIPSEAWKKAEQYIAILQPAIENDEFAVWYVKTDGSVGCVEYSTPNVVQPDTWHRMSMSVDLVLHRVEYFVDGVLCCTLDGNSATNQLQLLVDDRWSLDCEFYVGTDCDPQSVCELWISGIQTRSYSMSQAEIAIMGRAAQGGIPEPNHHHLSIKLAHDLQVPRSWCVLALESKGYNISAAYNWIQQQESVLIRRTRSEATMLTALGFRQRECVEALCSSGSLANAIEVLLQRGTKHGTQQTNESGEPLVSPQVKHVQPRILNALNQSQGNFNSKDLLSIGLAEDEYERTNRTYFIFPASNQEVVETFAEEETNEHQDNKEQALPPLHLGLGAINLGEIVWECAHDLFGAYAKLATVAIIESSVSVEEQPLHVQDKVVTMQQQHHEIEDTVPQPPMIPYASSGRPSSWIFNDSVGGKHFLRKYLKAFPESIRKDLATPQSMGEVSNPHDPIVVIRHKLWAMFQAETSVDPGLTPTKWEGSAMSALVEDVLHELVLLAKGPWTLLPCGLQGGPSLDLSEIWTDKYSFSKEEMDTVTRKKRSEEQVIREASVAIFRPFADSGFAILGDVATSLPAVSPPVLVVSDDDGYGGKATGPNGETLLAKPVGYKLVWQSNKLPCNQPVSIWKPVAPPGYAALGCVAQSGANQSSPMKDPTLKQLRCVHLSCLVNSNLRSGVWSLDSAEADSTGDEWSGNSGKGEPGPLTFWTVNNEAHTFVVRKVPTGLSEQDQRGVEDGIGPSMFCFPQPGWSPGSESTIGLVKATKNAARNNEWAAAGEGGARGWRKALAATNPSSKWSKSLVKVNQRDDERNDVHSKSITQLNHDSEGEMDTRPKNSEVPQDEDQILPYHLGNANGSQVATGSPELALWILQLLSEFDTVHGFGKFTRYVFSEEMLYAVLRFCRSATPAFRIKALRMVATVVNRAPLSAFTPQIRQDLMGLREHMERMYARQVAFRLDDDSMDEVALFSSLLCALSELFMAISARYDANGKLDESETFAPPTPRELDHLKLTSNETVDDARDRDEEVKVVETVEEANHEQDDLSQRTILEGMKRSYNLLRCQQAWFQQLEEMFTIMNALLYRDVYEMPTQFLMAEDTFMKLVLADKTAVRESSHPYNKDDAGGEVAIEGADCLLVRFDKRCSTNFGDALQLKSNGQVLETLQGCFGGCTVHVPSNRFTYHFPILHQLNWALCTTGSNVKGPDIRVSNSGLTATLRRDKVWQTVFADSGFDCGINMWEVLVERTSGSGNIFFGVATLDAKAKGYLGSDEYGWGWIGCMACWHGGRKVKQPFGERLKTKDVIRVTLDIPRRALTIARNGKDMGVAFDRLPPPSRVRQPGGHLFPAFAFYNKDDKITLLSGSPSSITMSQSLAASASVDSGRGSALLPLTASRFIGGITGASASGADSSRSLTVSERTGGARAIPAKRAIAAGTLSHLGYPMPWCIRALEACDDDVNNAAEYLISNASALEEEYKKEEADRDAEVKLQIRAEEDRWLADTAKLLQLDETSDHPKDNVDTNHYPSAKNAVEPIQVDGGVATRDGAVDDASVSLRDFVRDPRARPRPPFSFSLSGSESGASTRRRGRSRRGSSLSSTTSEAEPEWGFHFTVSPLFSKDVSSSLSHQTINKSKLDRIRKLFKDFTLNHDCELIQFVNEKCDKLGVDSVSLSPEDVTFNSIDPVRYPHLVGQSLVALQLRFLLLRNFNRRLASVLPLVDLSCADYESKLGASLRKLRGVVLKPVKQTLFGRVLAESHCGDDQSVRKEKSPLAKIDRNKAAHFLKTGKCDTAGTHTVFGQIYQQLHVQLASAEVLRNSHRAWYTVLIGESADDYGGPYRDVINQACQELMGPSLNLFIPCPNSRSLTGLCQEKWVPNPLAKNPTAIGMFEFVGKLMGIAMRTENPMVVYLPSLTWKYICRDTITLADVGMLDKRLADRLARVMDADTEERWSELESTEEIRFVTNSIDDTVVELISCGEDVPVTFNSREQYLALVKQYKFQELMPQCAAMARGLATQVPRHFLSLFTWEELEQLVCGPAEVDVEVLRMNTTYGDGFTENHPSVKMFWEVLSEMDQQDRQRYLRFVWGRSRLPVSSADWQRKHKLNVLKKDRPDDYLPIGHTCFFTLDLPVYTSVDVCRQKLLYAVTHCVAIDADETTNARLAAEDGDWSNNTGEDDI